MLWIGGNVYIPDREVEFNAVRSRGPGGQNVNKVSTAVQLRFDISASSLPELLKSRLLKLQDHRITKDGVVVIKAQSSRSQEKNKMAALMRLRHMIAGVTSVPGKRKPTRPTASAKKRRMDNKTRRGRLKKLRKTVTGGRDE